MKAAPSGVADRRVTWALAIGAMVVFVPLFVTRGAGRFDFWWWMAANTALLTALAACIDRGWRRAIAADLRHKVPTKAALGLLSAAVLYAVFFAGDLVSRRVFAPAASEIDDVYTFKNGVSLVRVALLMAFVIGPGEELFWRGFLQRRFQIHHGRWAGFFLAAGVYTLIHAGSLNVMLVVAALVAGLVWGLFYLRFGSMVLNVTSHVAWDLAVFVLFPFS